MKTLKPLVSVLACSCLLSGFATSVSAFDSVAYTGVWKNTSPALTLEIGAFSADITLNGETYTDDTLQFVPSQLNSAPFLYLNAQNRSGQQEYRFYLMTSADAQSNPRLNGYYDQVSLDAEGNKLATQSFPLNMEQTQQQLSAAK